MKIETFRLGSLETNSYMVINEMTNELLIVDPATCPDDIINHVKSKGYVPKAILLTHGHFDHVMGIDGWVKEFDISVYLHEEEKQVIEHAHINMSGVYSSVYSYYQAEGLQDGQEMDIAGFKFKVIHTPGHTVGGCCYYFEEERVLFSGDTLFYRCVGRSDLPTGDTATLGRSIKEKLFILSDDVKVYPGHGIPTCIGDEKTHNPYI